MDSETTCLQNIDSTPRWLWLVLAGTLGLTTSCGLAVVITAVAYSPSTPSLSSYPSNSTIGMSCRSTSDCIENSYCSISSSYSGTCQCVPGYYFSQSSSKCVVKGAYNAPCASNSECLDSKLLTCISTQCLCDTTALFWNSTVSECQYKKAAIGYCTSSSECVSNNCNGGYNKCLCSNSWFNTNTGTCDAKKTIGVSCSTDYECISGAYCSQVSKTCACDTVYFFSGGSCITKYILNWGCNLVDQCNIAQFNLRCIGGSCKCDPNVEYWDSVAANCFPRKKYGQTCSATTDCIDTSTYGLQCLTLTSAGVTRKACQCPSAQYFELKTGICTAKKSYNVECSSRNECSNVDTMVCESQSGSVTKRCTCAPNHAYYNSSSTSCILKKPLGTLCSAADQCAYGLECFSTSCGCDTSVKFYDPATKMCVWKKKLYDYCNAASQCASNSCCSSQYCC